MRSRRPQAADGSRLSAPTGPQYPQQSYADDGPSAQQRVPFGPEVSWPSGYYDLEYRNGAYSYPDEGPRADGRAALPSGPPGEHPYASFGPLGYGDPGYQDPGYEGPAAQDAGYQRGAGYAPPSGLPSGAPRLGPPQPGPPQPGNELERAQRHPALDGFNYDEPQYADGDLPDPRYPDTRFGQLGYDPEGYDASENELYAGSDDSRLAYDDPRYADDRGFASDQGLASGQRRFDETRFDMPAYRPGQDPADMRDGAPEAAHEPAGYDDYGPGYGGPGHDGPGNGDYGPGRGGHGPDHGDYGPDHGAGSPDHGQVVRGYVTGSDYDTDPGYGRGPGGGQAPGYGGADRAPGYGGADRDRGPRADSRGPQNFANTLAAPVGANTLAAPVGVYPPRADLQGQATGVMAPPEPVRRPNPSFDETSLDNYQATVFADPEAEPLAEDADTKRGRRRSGTKDRKQWIALGAVVVVAAGAIVGVLKLVTPSHPSGPTHQVAAPNQAGVYQRKPSLESQMKVAQLRASVIKSSSGQATNVVDGVYEVGDSGQGATPQIFVFVGGHLSNAPPDTSISSFTQQFPGAHLVSAGPLGGKAACVEVKRGTGAVAYCVWFDNDSFAELVSPTMTPSTLANVMTSTRPDFEKVASANTAGQ